MNTSSLSKVIVPVLIVLGLSMVGCGALQRHSINRRVMLAEYAFQHQVGFSLYDPAKGKFIGGYNDDNYFTPASNTKIFTFYTALKLLGERIPALDYVVASDSLIFWGVGNPALLHPDLRDTSAYTFLQNRAENLYFSQANRPGQHFGAGWAWDDYPYRFSTEKSSLPLYGNTFTLRKAAGAAPLSIDVPYFKKFFWRGDSLKDKTLVVRAYGSNMTTYHPDRTRKAFRRTVPFHINGTLIGLLLQDTLHRPIKMVDIPPRRDRKTIYGIAMDSLYKKMMQDSDNFIAEQLLLSAGSRIMNSLSTDSVISVVMDKYLQDLPDTPVWKDGSGLSRYNLFTPRTIVRLWEKIAKEVPEERLFELLAVGGRSGTLKNWYRADKPYVFGKTGTLSNNHCLSGFLITKKGRKLIFSYMNSNYPGSSKKVKEQMERILWEIHLNN